MTSSAEINEILKNKSEFLGCFSPNQLPVNIPASTLPKYLIVNTCCSQKKMGHWIVIYVKNCREIFYFNPLGCVGDNQPTNKIRQFLCSIFFKNIYFNTFPIQSNESQSCGLFCILFVKSVKTLNDFIRFMNKFNCKDLNENDKIIKMLMISCE